MEFDSQATTSTENFVEYEKKPINCKVLEPPFKYARLEPVEFASIKYV